MGGRGKERQESKRLRERRAWTGSRESARQRRDEKRKKRESKGRREEKTKGKRASVAVGGGGCLGKAVRAIAVWGWELHVYRTHNSLLLLLLLQRRRQRHHYFKWPVWGPSTTATVTRFLSIHISIAILNGDLHTAGLHTYRPAKGHTHGSPVSAGVPRILFGSLTEFKRTSSGRSDKITSSLGSNGDGDVTRA